MKKNRKKQILSGLLCLVMTLTLLPTMALAAGQFTDVTEANWFYADVEYAVAQGLVNGTTPTTYSPNSNLTYGAAIKLAACMHKKVTQGSTDFTVGTPWYQVYVDYAQANGIIPAGKTYDWNANATRAGYMEIFANAIPDTGLKNGYTELSAINKVDDGAIPDVPATHPQAAAIYKLYRAGILQGDETHKCSPDNYIRRSEVAAILTRMMNADARISFEMTTTSADSLTVTQQPADASVALGEKAQFTVAVSGGKSPYTYKWYSSADGASWTAIVNSSLYSGCATATLTVKADASTGLSYRCEITDATHGSVTSNAARLTVGAGALTITQQPQNVTCNADEWVTFSVAVSGGKAPYTYQWQAENNYEDHWKLEDDEYFTGTDTAELKTLVIDVDFEDGNRYSCVITDADGNSVTSSVAFAVKDTTTLKISQQPQNAYGMVDDWVSYSVAVSGGKAPYTYQWQLMSDTEDWYDLSDNYSYTNTDSATLKAKIVEQDLAFHCQYRCRITDASGSVVYSNAVCAIKQTGRNPDATPGRPNTSTSTGSTETDSSTPSRPTVTVSTSTDALHITTQPVNGSAAKGAKVTFTVEIAGGQGPFAYQWQYSTDNGESWLPVGNSTKYGGVTGATFTVLIESATGEKSRLYRCKISDAAHTVVYTDNVTASFRRTTRPYVGH